MSPAIAATTTIAAMIGTGFLYHGAGGSLPSGSPKPVPGGVPGGMAPASPVAGICVVASG